MVSNSADAGERRTVRPALPSEFSDDPPTGLSSFGADEALTETVFGGSASSPESRSEPLSRDIIYGKRRAAACAVRCCSSAAAARRAAPPLLRCANSARDDFLAPTVAKYTQTPGVPPLMRTPLLGGRWGGAGRPVCPFGKSEIFPKGRPAEPRLWSPCLLRLASCPIKAHRGCGSGAGASVEPCRAPRRHALYRCWSPCYCR